MKIGMIVQTGPDRFEIIGWNGRAVIIHRDIATIIKGKVIEIYQRQFGSSPPSKDFLIYIKDAIFLGDFDAFIDWIKVATPEEVEAQHMMFSLGSLGK